MSTSEPVSDHHQTEVHVPAFKDIRALINTVGLRKREGPKIRRAVQDSIDREDALRAIVKTNSAANRKLRSCLATAQAALEAIRNAGPATTATQLRRRADIALGELILAGVSVQSIATRSGDVAFSAIATANRNRCRRWHPGFPDDNWSIADWSNAMCGEVGEVATRIGELRRLERFEFPGAIVIPGPDRGSVQDVSSDIERKLEAELAFELADVFLYATLLAAKCCLDLPRSVVAAIDERMGQPSGLVPQTLRYAEVATVLAGSQPLSRDGVGLMGDESMAALFSHAGEAANVVKKLRRRDTDVPDVRQLAPDLPTGDSTSLFARLTRLLGEVVTDIVTIAQHHGVDLPQALVEKFNIVSDQQGFPERLELELLAPTLLETTA